VVQQEYGCSSSSSKDYVRVGEQRGGTLRRARTVIVVVGVVVNGAHTRVTTQRNAHASSVSRANCTSYEAGEQ